MSRFLYGGAYMANAMFRPPPPQFVLFILLLCMVMFASLKVLSTVHTIGQDVSAIVQQHISR